jgi:hypothetical protein
MPKRDSLQKDLNRVPGAEPILGFGSIYNVPFSPLSKRDGILGRPAMNPVRSDHTNKRKRFRGFPQALPREKLSHRHRDGSWACEVADL